MSQKPETAIVDRIQEFIRQHHGEALKVHGSAMQRSGEPDLIGGFAVVGETSKYAGINFVYEVKLPNEKPRADQIYRLKRWARLGYAAGWGTSVDDFRSFLDAQIEYKTLGTPKRNAEVYGGSSTSDT